MGEIAVQRCLAQLAAVKNSLGRVKTEARLESDDIVDAGFGLDADEQIDDLIRSVADHYPFGVHGII